MKKIFLLCLYAALYLTSCDFEGETIEGNGNFRSEVRNVSRASRIKVNGHIEVVIDRGATAVKVEADENILRYIQTEVHDGWLQIRTADNVNVRSSQPIKVYVKTDELDALEVNGSGNATCNDRFSSSNNMSFAVSGSGNIRAHINTPSTRASISGSGNMYLTGETRDLDIDINGSGNYDSFDLKAENAEVDISGSGNVNLFADATLKASIAGSGDVRYKGKASVNQHVAGSGRVHQIP